jgi:hypothetical protein
MSDRSILNHEQMSTLLILTTCFSRRSAPPNPRSTGRAGTDFLFGDCRCRRPGWLDRVRLLPKKSQSVQRLRVVREDFFFDGGVDAFHSLEFI